MRWLAVVMLVVATALGLLVNYVTVALFAYVIVAGVRRFIALMRRQLPVQWLRQPFAHEHRLRLVRSLLGLVLVAQIVFTQRVSIIPEQLGDDYLSLRMVLVATAIVAALIQLMPLGTLARARVFPIAAANIFLFTMLAMIYRQPPDPVQLANPMREELLVMQGGPSPVVNHHYVVHAQRHALDLVVVERERIYADARAGNEHSLCFGKTVQAPAAGSVVRAADGLHDNIGDQTDREHLVGNHVVIDIGQNRYVLLAHLRAGSVKVKAGDHVETGDPVGECGNSGNSTEAHLHIQVQDQADYTGDVTTYPIALAGRVLRRNGRVPRQ